MTDNTAEQVCVWCEKKAAHAAHRIRVGVVVCLSCYQLLMTAGISNEEIFAQRAPAKEVSPAKKK